MGSSTGQKTAQSGVDVTQQGLSNTQQNLFNQYPGFYNNFQNASSRNPQDYAGILSGYQQFLSGQNPGMGGINYPMGSTPQPQNLQPPAAGTLFPLGPSNVNPYLQNNPGMGSPNAGQPVNQLTGDPQKDAILNLYNKYGIKAGAPGSGLSDLDYWSNKIGSSGDQGYVTGRLESDLQGKGPDAGGGGPTSAIGGLQSFLGGPAISGYTDFSATGGFSPQDKQNILAQAEAPARAIYQNAQNDLQTQMARTGGYMPNAGAAQNALARGATQAISANDIAANAGLAQMVQQGRLAGLGGLTGAELGGLGQLGGQQLGALGGMTGAYGTSPGLMGLTGNQLLGTTGQQLQGNALQNQIASIMLGAAQLPTGFQQMMGNIGSVAGLLPGLGGLGSIFGGGMGTPSLSAGDMPRAGSVFG